MGSVQQKVEIKDKLLLTIEEAALLSNIGRNRLREIGSNPECPFIIKCGVVGGKLLVNRKKFEEYLDTCTVI